MKYSQWNAEQLMVGYRSLKADVDCTEVFLKNQKEELAALVAVLKSRGIDVTEK